MGIFSRKKEVKKDHSLPPPPPPIPPKELVGDLEPIRPSSFKEPPAPTAPNLSIPELPLEKDEKEAVVAEPAPVPQQVMTGSSTRHEDVAQPVFGGEVKEEHKGPFFVSLSDYEQIELDVNSIKALLNDADVTLKSLNDTLDEEDKLFDRWRSFIEGVEKKLIFVDKIIEKTGE
ncbi:hypothetical protein DRJ25_04235 [Candidatus Woesearchaeota archaeon]|nr:MAG: hypothetical protein DRJ25_04235 [Candidatus Woesearchaeota archaeon]